MAGRRPVVRPTRRGVERLDGRPADPPDRGVLAGADRRGPGVRQRDGQQAVRRADRDGGGTGSAHRGLGRGRGETGAARAGGSVGDRAASPVGSGAPGRRYPGRVHLRGHPGQRAPGGRHGVHRMAGQPSRRAARPARQRGQQPVPGRSGVGGHRRRRLRPGLLLGPGHLPAVRRGGRQDPQRLDLGSEDDRHVQGPAGRLRPRGRRRGNAARRRAHRAERHHVRPEGTGPGHRRAQRLTGEPTPRGGRHPMTTTAPPGSAPRTITPVPTTGRVTTRGRERAACGVLMAPFLVLLVAVFLIPVCTAVWLSFFGADQPGLGFGPERTVFVGWRSYAVVFTDPTFLAGLATVIGYCLLYIPLLVVGALALALLFDSGAARLRSWAQLGLFLPHAVPGIIAAIIWLYLYTPGLSPVVALLARADLTINFLGARAALRAVPREIIEASVVDGAGPVRTALRVKTPLIRSSIVMVVLFTLIWALQLFTEPMLLSQSSPMISSRFSPTMYIYDAAFTRNNYSLAAAASVILLLCTIALSYGVTRWSNRAGSRGEA